MLTVLCWRWGARYGTEYVTRLRAMLERHLHLPYRLVCVTDEPDALGAGIETVPMWAPGWFGRARRLRVFDAEAEARIGGARILQLDIDVVITGDLTPLVDRAEPLVAWKTPPDLRYSPALRAPVPNVPDDAGKGPFNTSMLLRDAGIFPALWRDYCADPFALEDRAREAGLWSVLWRSDKQRVAPLSPGDDDQAVISLYAKPLDPPRWTEADGVYKWGRGGFMDKAALPADARVVFFNGSIGANRPGDPQCGPLPEWIEEHWR